MEKEKRDNPKNKQLRKRLPTGPAEEQKITVDKNSVINFTAAKFYFAELMFDYVIRTYTNTYVNLLNVKTILKALSNILWVVVLDFDFFVQDIAFVPSYSHVS